MEVTDSGTVSLLMPVQFPNAAQPIVSSPSGRVNSLTAAQSRKAYSPIFFSESGSFTSAREVQLLNAYLSMLVILVPLRSTSVRHFRFANACCGILSPPVIVIFVSL